MSFFGSLLADLLEWLRMDPAERPVVPAVSHPADQRRGERNNNPGNLDYHPEIAYQGQLGLEIVPPGLTYRARFARFDTPHDGLRALGVCLVAYHRHHGVNTIRSDVERFAPAGDDNVPSAYENAMAKSTGFGVDQVINFEDADGVLCKLIKGHVLVEEGRCIYSDDDVLAAARSAVTPAPQA